MLQIKLVKVKHCSQEAFKVRFLAHPIFNKMYLKRISLGRPYGTIIWEETVHQHEWTLASIEGAGIWTEAGVLSSNNCLIIRGLMKGSASDGLQVLEVLPM